MYHHIHLHTRRHWNEWYWNCYFRSPVQVCTNNTVCAKQLTVLWINFLQLH